MHCIAHYTFSTIDLQKKKEVCKFNTTVKLFDKPKDKPKPVFLKSANFHFILFLFSGFQSSYEHINAYLISLFM